METLIVQPATRSKLEALKAFLAALKIDFKTAGEGDADEITNPETLRRIEAYEQGTIQPEAHSLKEVKALLNA